MTKATIPTTAAERDAIALCRESITQHSKSFALASRLLPEESRDAARVDLRCDKKGSSQNDACI